ncbi:MAG TPA: outer membrane protein assembly factor BamD [Thermoanaerobaculaceae bacterium]|nr:outer membrane protein assembly factor BamD [Thermoanaerobaculaceae bacterium]
MRRWLAVAVALALAACHSSRNTEQAFLDEVGAQSKEQIMARGDALAAKKKWEEARKYYTFLSDTFPNDPIGRRATLKVADSFFALADTEGYTEAQLRYKDFSNRFPSDPSRAYALLMLAKCSFKQHKGPLRDLTPLHEATDSLKQMLQLFPNSPYAPEAKTMLAKCLEELAQHEFLIAKYYANVQAWVGAKQRLDYLFENYPETATAATAKPLMAKVEERLAPRPLVSPTTSEKAKSAAQH